MQKSDTIGAVAMTEEKVSLDALNALIINGDMSKLTPPQKLAYYHQVCERAGLNPYTRPFDYMVLNGKQVLYANKGCAEQIRSIKGISVTSMTQERVSDLILITVEGKDATGRVDTEMGFAKVDKLTGDALGNAILKAMTKAKRRLTLSMAGLGMLDETEVDSIPNAQKMVDVTPTEEQIEQPKKERAAPGSMSRAIKPPEPGPEAVNEDGEVVSLESASTAGFGNYITDEQLMILGDYITAKNIPMSTQKAWLERAAISKITDLPKDKAELLINSMKDKP